MVGPSAQTAIFAHDDRKVAAPIVVSRTGQLGPAPLIYPGVNAPQVPNCTSACYAGNGVGSAPSGLKALGTLITRVQDYGRGAFSRAIGGIHVLLTPP